MFREIAPQELQDNPFTLIGKDWLLITAGNREKCNTMTASWGGVGVLWNQDVCTIYIRPQRYTKEFVDGEKEFSLCVMDSSYREALSLCGTKSGRDMDKIAAYIALAIDDFANNADEIRAGVTELCAKYPLYE